MYAWKAGLGYMRTVVSTIITFIWHSYYNRNHSKRTSFLCLYVTYKWKTVTCVQCWPVGHCVWDDSQHRPSHSSRLVFLHECTAPAQNYKDTLKKEEVFQIQFLTFYLHGDCVILAGWYPVGYYTDLFQMHSMKRENNYGLWKEMAMHI